MADKMSDMKTVTVRELLRSHDRFASMVAAGETVIVTKRRKAIYRMAPVDTPRRKFPDVMARLKKIYGNKVIPHEKVAAILRADRGAE